MGPYLMISRSSSGAGHHLLFVMELTGKLKLEKEEAALPSLLGSKPGVSWIPKLH